MNFQFATRAIGTARLALKAHAPTLMVVGGVASMGAAVVTASKQTLKIEEVLAPHTALLERIQEGHNQPMLDGSSYTPEKARSDRFKVYTRVGYDMTKLYAVPGVLFIGGACLVFGGHRIMLKRNATLAVAFTTLQKAYDKYRENTARAMGPEFDAAMLKGFVNKEVVDPETGKTEVISALDWDAESSDPYNRVFEQGESTMWRPDLGINKDFLEVQQQYCQQRLNGRGYLYLFEVYESLGFEPSPISRVVGWKVERLPDGSKNIPMVDFGLNKRLADDYKYSAEHAIYLDFNCQGLIVGGIVQKIMEEA